MSHYVQLQCHTVYREPDQVAVAIVNYSALLAEHSAKKCQALTYTSLCVNLKKNYKRKEQA
jgi:hypothetical protein